MSQLKTIADLKDLVTYKKDLKADLERLKASPVAMTWVEVFDFPGGKRGAAVLLGAVDAKLQAELKAAGKQLKTGKCKRNERDEVEIIGGLKPGLLAGLFKTLGLAEKVCETVGGGGGGIDDDTAEAVGNLVKRADQEAAEATADKLTDTYETLQKKFGAVYDEARRMGLSTDALIAAERAIEKALKQTSATIADQADALKKQILEYGALGKGLGETIAARKQEAIEAGQREAEKQRIQDEKDRQLLEGVGKKKPAPTAKPAQPQAQPQGKAKPKYVPLNLGTMTFKEKFAAGMVRQVDGVEKKITGFDKNGGFSTHYYFAQGDDDKPAYEIHIHRGANGRFLTGQVKFGHLAKVVKGGEEGLSAGEMATYGIAAVETYP